MPKPAAGVEHRARRPPRPARTAPSPSSLGSFHDAERAANEAKRLDTLGLAVRVEVETVEGATWHRLRFGRYRTREEAEESALARCTGLGWRVVRVGP